MLKNSILKYKNKLFTILFYFIFVKSFIMTKLKHKGNIDTNILANVLREVDFVEDIIVKNNSIIAKLGNCKGIELRLKKQCAKISTSFTSRSCRLWFYFSILFLGLILPLLIYLFAWYIPSLVYRKKLVNILKNSLQSY